jgi:transposase
MGEKLISETLFVFYKRRKPAVKCIYWDRTGFALWEKELEENLFHPPIKKLPEKIAHTQLQARWLLEGIDVWVIRPQKEVEDKYAVLGFLDNGPHLFR